jgi:hypothetical protein
VTSAGRNTTKQHTAKRRLAAKRLTAKRLGEPDTEPWACERVSAFGYPAAPRRAGHVNEILAKELRPAHCAPKRAAVSTRPHCTTQAELG